MGAGVHYFVTLRYLVLVRIFQHRQHMKAHGLAPPRTDVSRADDEQVGSW